MDLWLHWLDWLGWLAQLVFGTLHHARVWDLERRHVLQHHERGCVGLAVGTRMQLVVGHWAICHFRCWSQRVLACDLIQLLSLYRRSLCPGDLGQLLRNALRRHDWLVLAWSHRIAHSLWILLGGTERLLRVERRLGGIERLLGGIELLIVGRKTHISALLQLCIYDAIITWHLHGSIHCLMANELPDG